jgi:hypothetical protein
MIMAIPWGKILHAAIVGGIEFVNALDEDVDLEAVAKRAMETVQKNRTAKAAAEAKEDDVFTSVDDGGEG